MSRESNKSSAVKSKGEEEMLVFEKKHYAILLTNDITNIIRRHHYLSTISFTSLASTIAAKSPWIIPVSSISPVHAISVVITATWELFATKTAFSTTKPSSIPILGITIPLSWAWVLVSIFCWISKSICSSSTKAGSPSIRKIFLLVSVKGIVPSSSARRNIRILRSAPGIVWFFFPVAHFRSNWCLLELRTPRILLKCCVEWSLHRQAAMSVCATAWAHGIDGTQFSQPLLENVLVVVKINWVILG